MATWGVEARIKYRAWNTSTNAGVAGDSANHTLTLRREGTDSTFVGTVNDLGNGVYEAVVSGSLAETYELAMRGTSATADVVLFFESPVRTVKAAPTLTEIANQIEADHGAGSYVDTGPGLDAAGVRTAVGLASANLDTQLAAIPTTTPLDATATEAAALAAVTSYAPAKAGDAMTLTAGERAAVRSDLLTETIYGQSLPSNFGSLVIDGDGVVHASVEQVAGVAVSGVGDFKADVSGLLAKTQFDAALPTNFGVLSIDTSGNVTTTAGGSGGATAQEVWEYTTRTLTAIDLSGLEVNALTPEQAAWIEAIYGKTALIGSPGVFAYRKIPVITANAIEELVAGDDYAASMNRSLQWTRPTSLFGDFTGATTTFMAVCIDGDSATIGPVAGTVKDEGTEAQSVEFELSKTDTAVHEGAYAWAVVVTKETQTLTVARGNTRVVGGLT